MKKAILMMTFGSPEEISFEGVAEFFTNIRRGVRPQDHEIQTLYDNYVLIGGTPLQRISLEEVEKVRQGLSGEYAVYFANKFSRPFIPDVIEQMEEDGYEKFIQSDSIRFNIIKEWYQEEAILDYWAEELRKILTEEVGEETFKIFFSAHSVPILALDFGDPYIDQIYDNARLIAERLGLTEEDYLNVWQSESDIGLPWIKPDVLDYMRQQETHPKHYIFVPISFISEHIEVLFDNDVECKELCNDLGVAYHRPPMPNADDRLIDSLIQTIRRHEHEPFKECFPEEETFDELQPSEESSQILAEDAELKMPDFVKKLIEKKGRENVKMPYFVKKMLEKAGKLPKS